MHKHLDEVKRDVIQKLEELVRGYSPAIEKIVLIEDIYGSLRLVLWADRSAENELRDIVNETLQGVAAPYWSGDIWLGNEPGKANQQVYSKAWRDAQPLDEHDRIRYLGRYRTRDVWFRVPTEPLWKATAGPPIVLFYSFKGGMGRSTAAASFAIQRARKGERVVVIDFDLDAPGIGSLLAADARGTTAQWGVVDYLLERPFGEVPLSDYYHACRRPEIVQSGEILVVPAGRLDDDYPGKLARLDFSSDAVAGRDSVIKNLFDQIRKELQPDWLVVDTRTGLADQSLALMSGAAHLHVLFGNASQQSLAGLRLVLERFGKERILANKQQLDCLLVQAMVPDANASAEDAKRVFAQETEILFSELYYAADPEEGSEDEDDLWYIRDMENESAPHIPIPITYKVRLAHFTDIAEVVDVLAQDKEYLHLGRRIAQRFGRTEEQNDEH